MTNEDRVQEKREVIRLLKKEPYLFGRSIGFKKLTPLNNEWIRDMVFNPDGKGDTTKQAHRGSYKTTSVSVSLALIMILFPDDTTIFFRKTDSAVKEIIHQVAKMLKHPVTKRIVKVLYGKDLQLIKETAFELSTNLSETPRGTSQLCSSGIKSSITGQHYDRIFTDDIVTLDDRTSRAEREETKNHYYELLNLINKGGRIYNTGTPWHKDDCFKIMPEPERHDCYSTGIMTEAEIAEKKESMPPSLFAANYELRHVASEDIIFDERPTNASIELVKDGICHLDSAFFGSDYTAFSAMKFVNGKFLLYGRCWRRNVQDCYISIHEDYDRLALGKCYMETNADKGMVARDMKRMGMRIATYNESTNKHVKIVTYLKAIWKYVEFVEGTDPEYIDMVLDYNENAEHDDAPDSAACLARLLYRKAGIRIALDLSEPTLQDA